MEEQLELEDAIAKAKAEEVNSEFEKAVAAAKEFHPVTKMYVDGYTGEVSRYKTPDNYVPDEGVVNDLPDLCHTEDHVSIAQMYDRLKRMQALSIQDADFDFDEGNISADDLDEETLSDVVSEVDDPADYENYVEPFFEEKYGRQESAEPQKAGESLEGSADEGQAPQEA